MGNENRVFWSIRRGSQDLLECLPENLESMNGDIAVVCCHDTWKYSLRFQRRLQKGDVQVDHSTAGAQLCAAKGGYYSFLNYCIAGHHAGLPDCGSNTDNGGESTLSGRLKKKIEDYQAYQSEIEVPLLHSAPIDPKAVPNPYFSLSFFMRMIYSCLVDADFLDTEAFMKQGKTERDPGTRIEELYRKLDKYLENKRWLENKKPIRSTADEVRFCGIVWTWEPRKRECFV